MSPMISVHIMYPKTEDSTFDMDYYCATHMPMLADALGDACKGWGATTCLGGDIAAMAEHGAAIMGDVANYTNVAPQLVLGEVAH